MIFTILKNIKEILTIGSLAAAILFGYMNQMNKGRADNAENNLYSKTIQWENEKGQLVTETTELRITTKELKNAVRKKEEERSKLEQTVAEAYETMEDMNIRAKDAESYHKDVIKSLTENIVTEIIYESDSTMKAIKPIITPNLEIHFEIIDSNKILVDHLYKAAIKTVVSRDRTKVTKRGNKRFFLARWAFPKWNYSAKSVIDDPNGEIETSVDINFQRRKGKRI